MMKSPWCSLILMVLTGLSRPVYCKKVHEVHWNASNPMFRIDNTDNVIDVNESDEIDQANIVCPHYKGTSTDEGKKETYIIYNVSKEEFDSCRILNPHPRVIAVCDKPDKGIFFTITFRSFTPTPGGLEFIPGNDYYFISTSSEEDLHRRAGGKCISHNMKVIFKIAPNKRSGGPMKDAPSRESFSSIPRQEKKPHKERYPRRKKKERFREETTAFKQEASRMPSASSASYLRSKTLLTLLSVLLIFSR